MGSEDFTVSRLSADDRLLLERLRRKDSNAIAAIERRYGPELRLFARRMLADAQAAEDVVQDLLAVCCQLTAESLPETSLRGWLYQVCRRRCIDLNRRKRASAASDDRGLRAPQSNLDNAVDPLTTPSGKALKRDRALRLLAVLRDMDEDLRSVILLRYFQDLPRDEIAEALGLSLAGAKARLSRAVEELRQRLRDAGESAAL